MVQPKRHRTLQKHQRTAQRAQIQTSGFSGSGLALVASAIGNIVQATKNRNLEREHGRLVAILRDWQEAYQRLEERTRKLRMAYETVAAQLEKSEHECQQWHVRLLECEKELKTRHLATTSLEERKR